MLIEYFTLILFSEQHGYLQSQNELCNESDFIQRQAPTGFMPMSQMLQLTSTTDDLIKPALNGTGTYYELITIKRVKGWRWLEFEFVMFIQINQRNKYTEILQCLKIDFFL